MGRSRECGVPRLRKKMCIRDSFGGLFLTVHAHDGKLTVRHIDADEVTLFHQGDGDVYKRQLCA